MTRVIDCVVLCGFPLGGYGDVVSRLVQEVGTHYKEACVPGDGGCTLERVEIIRLDGAVWNGDVGTTLRRRFGFGAHQHSLVRLAAEGVCTVLVAWTPSDRGNDHAVGMLTHLRDEARNAAGWPDLEARLAYAIVNPMGTMYEGHTALELKPVICGAPSLQAPGVIDPHAFALATALALHQLVLKEP